MATSAVPVGNGTVTVPLVGQAAWADPMYKALKISATRFVLRIIDALIYEDIIASLANCRQIHGTLVCSQE